MVNISLAWFPIIICFLGLGTPMGFVPGEEDPLLMRMAPQNAVFYASWAGTQEADPKGNPTEQWIAQKDMQRFWKDMDTRLKDLSGKAFKQSHNPVSANINALTVKLPKLLCRQPCGIYIDRVEIKEKNTVPGFAGVLAINLGDRKNEISKHLDLAKEAIDENESVEISKEYEIDWLVHRSKKWIKTKIGMYEQYLVIGFAQGSLEPDINSFFENKDTPEPKWLTTIKQKLPVPRRASVGFIDVKELLNNADERLFGFRILASEKKLLEKLTTIGFVNGLDDEGFLGRIWLPGANEAEFAKVLNGPIDRDFLSKMPVGGGGAAAARISKDELYRALKSTIGSAQGNAKAFEESIAGFEAFSGLTLKEDLLNNLGDNVALVGSSEVFSTQATCLCFQIEDDMAFLDTIDGFARRLNEVSEDGSFGFETKMIDGVKVHHVTLPQRWNSVKEIYFAQQGFRLMVANKLEIFKEVLGAEKNKEDEIWIQTPRMQQLYEFAKNQKLGEPSLVFEVNPESTLSQLSSLSHSFKRMGFAEFPDQKTMANGLKPNLNAMFKREDGIEVIQKHVLPMGNPVSFLGFAGVTAEMLRVTEKLPKE